MNSLDWRKLEARWPVHLLLLLAILISRNEKRLHAEESEQKFAELGQCKLESGEVIEECRVGYRTFGKLDPAGDNAVLMPTWLFGKSADLVSLFGDGHLPSQSIDDTRFFGIAIDAFSNGVSSSPSNSNGQHGTKFPKFTLRDCVSAQYRVVTEILHIHHLHAVVGLSMGGEQTFVWMVMHPEFFDLAVPILGTPRLTSYDLMVKHIQLEAIRTAAGYNGGSYTVQPDLSLANLIGALVVTSPANRNREIAPDKLADSIKHAEAPQPIDANDRVWQLMAITRQDVIGKRSLAEAARAVKPKLLVIVNAEDHLVNPQPALDWAAAAGAATYISHGDCAHLIMNCDAEAVSSRVKAFLSYGTTSK